MLPPVFSLANASATVKAELGSVPLRLWQFGMAPQSGQPGFGFPYAVWQSITINPDNYLTDVPDADAMGVQIDVYAKTPDSARNAAKTLRDVYQLHGFVIAMREWPKEAETQLFRYQLDVDFIEYR